MNYSAQKFNAGHFLRSTQAVPDGWMYQLLCLPTQAAPYACTCNLFDLQNMCNSNGTSCNLDINNPALNSTGPNDVLKVIWKCGW
jgi:hypothetical protein